MLSVTVGRTRVSRRKLSGVLQVIVVLVLAVVILTLILQNYSRPIRDGFLQVLPERPKTGGLSPTRAFSGCGPKTNCSRGQVGFFLQSGAANVLQAKICIRDKLVQGAVRSNAGSGINIVVLNGKTGDVVDRAFFNMYSGDTQPLIDFLKKIEDGSAVLMATADDPATKLNEEARKLISDLGSSHIHSLAFRDNWLFVGEKGAKEKSIYEKMLKNDHEKNKYEDWPELIRLQGCIPL